jgi:hypothetical protein
MMGKMHGDKNETIPAKKATRIGTASITVIIPREQG